jgi:hypothetical protein
VREQDLFLLDHESSDGSTDKANAGSAVVIRVANGGVHDHQVSGLQVR